MDILFQAGYAYSEEEDQRTLHFENKSLNIQSLRNSQQNYRKQYKPNNGQHFKAQNRSTPIQ